MNTPFTISVCVLSVCVFPLPAQELHNESIVYIVGANMYVDGSIANKGRMQNDGLISFTGDWRSDGIYTGKGTMEARGDATQIVFHTDGPVNSLVIDGWGTKHINGTMSVSGKLQMTKGVVEVSPGNALVLAARAVVSGGSTESYVDGALTVEGEGYKFFPIGKNGIYAPIEFMDVSAKGCRYAMEVFENAPAVSVENVIVKKALYWRRNDITGNFRASRVAIDYERDFFEDSHNVILVAGSSFDQPFATIDDLDRSPETDKILTHEPVSAPIIMLGEMSDKWTEADFYLSTALSSHAFHSENKTVKIFGDRLREDQFRFQVFDRWGDLVYENASLERMRQHGWDGRTLRGVQLATGTYPYHLSALDKTGKRFEKTGIITIVH